MSSVLVVGKVLLPTGGVPGGSLEFRLVQRVLKSGGVVYSRQPATAAIASDGWVRVTLEEGQSYDVTAVGGASFSLGRWTVPSGLKICSLFDCWRATLTSPSDSLRLYANFAEGLTKTPQRGVDAGLTWTLIQRLGAQTEIHSLAYAGGGQVLAGTAPTGQIYRSTDNGLTWTLIQRLGSETEVLSLVNLGGGLVLAGTAPTGQIYRSTDSGLTWTLIQRLGSEIDVHSALSLGGGVVLAGTGPTGQIYRSTDNGLTWTLIQRLGSESKVNKMAAGGGIVLASTSYSGQIYRSTDNGLTWTLIQRLGSETEVLSLVNLGGGQVLAGTAPTGQIYRSTDNGLTWTLIQRLGSEGEIFGLVNLGGGLVLAGTAPTGQIYRSTDSGLTWTLIQRLGSESQAFDLVTFAGGLVLAGTAPTGQIYRSFDEVWTAESSFYNLDNTDNVNLSQGTLVLKITPVGWHGGDSLAHTLIDCYPAASNSIQVVKDASNNLVFQITDNAGAAKQKLMVASSGTLPAGTPAKIACRWNAGVLKLRLNAADAATDGGTGSGTLSSIPMQMLVGLVNITVHKVATFDRELTDTELTNFLASL